MGFRAWGAKQNLAYALSVPATQADATTPAGFAGGGDQVSIYNSGATDVLVAFYKNASGKPTLVFPVTGSPPTGEGAGAPTSPTLAEGRTAVVVPKGARIQVSVGILVDSFSAIGSAAGPSIVYVQRGDGST